MYIYTYYRVNLYIYTHIYIYKHVFVLFQHMRQSPHAELEVCGRGHNSTLQMPACGEVRFACWPWLSSHPSCGSSWSALGLVRARGQVELTQPAVFRRNHQSVESSRPRAERDGSGGLHSPLAKGSRTMWCCLACGLVLVASCELQVNSDAVLRGFLITLAAAGGFPTSRRFRQRIGAPCTC